MKFVTNIIYSSFCHVGYKPKQEADNKSNSRPPMDDVKKPANHKPLETRLTTSQGKFSSQSLFYFHQFIYFILYRLLSVQPSKLWEITVRWLQPSATSDSPSSPGGGGDRSQEMKVQTQLQFRDITIIHSSITAAAILLHLIIPSLNPATGQVSIW